MALPLVVLFAALALLGAILLAPLMLPGALLVAVVFGLVQLALHFHRHHVPYSHHGS